MSATKNQEMAQQSAKVTPVTPVERNSGWDSVENSPNHRHLKINDSLARLVASYSDHP